MTLPDSYSVKDMVLAALIGATVTGAGQWYVVMRDMVTHQELEVYVATNSPYTRDSALIRQRLDDIAAAVSRLPDVDRRLSRVEALVDKR